MIFVFFTILKNHEFLKFMNTFKILELFLEFVNFFLIHEPILNL